ncbi:anther-specific proline-rich protein APG-like [Alosa alosa]|uniref:anther-specific proline-rich protein APG-like n=1 Tax=Alosa alosa TaxID=278164 RepID=UPI0020151F65|nr:anther-specific proline-rich protein APG-like [Alosa alosa]
MDPADSEPPSASKLLSQTGNFRRSLQALLVPSSEAVSPQPDPAPTSTGCRPECQGLRVGQVSLKPADPTSNLQPAQVQFSPHAEVSQESPFCRTRLARKPPSRRRRGAKLWPTWSSDTMPPVPSLEAPVPVPAAESAPVPAATPAAQPPEATPPSDCLPELDPPRSDFPVPPLPEPVPPHSDCPVPLLPEPLSVHPVEVLSVGVWSSSNISL